ncbi:iron ABC transporter permease [Rhabdobacter roseus]|uniref:Iron complex transport system permease protein n=1 Tax=Rhabdobacter roseus TaxID=1655419 RepID=A0A840TDF8_9BACT|nr:iron ABC transporter permease [Rhabdobacter roseus]MBB5282136.1 iron complex transport system permease protein [Rhabdobacter roseus]
MSQTDTLTQPRREAGTFTARRRSRAGALGLLAALLVLAVLISVCTGAMAISLPELAGIVTQQLGMEAAYPFEEHQKIIFWFMRLPRICLGILIGAGLSVAGALLQSLFRNPLADPMLIGISSGATLFAVLAIVLGTFFSGLLGGLLGSYLLSFAAFMGACLAILLVYQLSKVNGRSQITTMLLAGIAINAFVNALTGLLISMANDEQLRSITFWGLGSLGGATWTTVLTVLPFIGLTLLYMPRLAKSLNLLALGESQAAHLGVNTTRLKRQTILLVTLTVGASVAVAGTIGFVGLVIPHIIRQAFGPHHRLVLSGSALAGAAVLTLADTLSRTLVAPSELPIGVLTALMGTPVFVYILLKEKRYTHD